MVKHLKLRPGKAKVAIISIFIFCASLFGGSAQLPMPPKNAEEKCILLDGYFNHELQKDSSGHSFQTHYLWEETDNGGLSVLKQVFNRHSLQTKFLKEAVTKQALLNTNIYFIIDPDVPSENPSPNYITPEESAIIYNWVSDGGVLMLFANDSGNAEFKHLNELAGRFGIHFNEHHKRNLVRGEDYRMGTINIPAGNAIFPTAKNLFIKDICTISVVPPAVSALTDNGDIIIAVANTGKGIVFAIGDPWLYNEYIDSRKLPPYIENLKAADDLVQWLVKQTVHEIK